jgi:hypothetical protein
MRNGINKGKKRKKHKIHAFKTKQKIHVGLNWLIAAQVIVVPVPVIFTTEKMNHRLVQAVMLVHTRSFL